MQSTVNLKGSNVKKKGYLALPKKVRQRNAIIVGSILLVLLFVGITKGFISLYNWNTQRIIDSLTFTEVVVSSGDTAFSLQSELTPTEDVREMIFYAEKVSGKNLSDIKVGEKITLVSQKK